MNDLIRPTLYEAYHEIHAGCAKPRADAPRMVADVVGRFARRAIISRSNRNGRSRRKAICWPS
jgi:hypothetical protein